MKNHYRLIAFDLSIKKELNADVKEATLKTTKKNFQDEELPHELFLTTS